MPRPGLEPSSVLRLAFQSDTVPTELYPPQVLLRSSTDTRIPRASMLKVKHLPALFSLPCSKDIHILFRFGSVTNEAIEQNVAHGYFSVLSKPVSLRSCELSVVY